MRIKIGTKSVLHEVECTLNESRDFQEIASKDIDGKEYNPGSGTWSLSANAIADNSTGSAQVDLKAVVDAYQAKTLVDIELTDGVVGNLSYTGQAYIENYSLKSANQEKVTFDYALKGVGALTVVINA
jgi:predicted secreted protein